MEHDDFCQIYLQEDNPEAAVVNSDSREEKSEHCEEKHPEDEFIHTEDLSVYSFLKHVVFLASEET